MGSTAEFNSEGLRSFPRRAVHALACPFWCCEIFAKGMLRRNIEPFLKEPMSEKLGIPEMKKLNFFFYFQLSVFSIFVKI